MSAAGDGPRFVVLGAGALGSVIAGLLLARGHHVEIIARGGRARQLRADGLRVTGLAELTLPCEPHDATGVRDDPDFLILTAKTWQMRSALDDVGHLRPRAVMSVANGVLKNEQLAACFGRERVIGCMANFSADLGADGLVEYTRNEGFQVGALEPAAADAAGQLAQLLRETGVKANAVGDIVTMEWTKFVAWVAYMAMAVLTRLPTGEFASDPDLAAVMVRMIREMDAIAAAEGITVTNSKLMPVRDLVEAGDAEAVAMVLQAGEAMKTGSPGHRMSALQDVEAGRRLEVDETLGDALARAVRHGIAAPTLATLHALVVAVDRPRR